MRVNSETRLRLIENSRRLISRCQLRLDGLHLLLHFRTGHPTITEGDHVMHDEIGTLALLSDVGVINGVSRKHDGSAFGIYSIAEGGIAVPVFDAECGYLHAVSEVDESIADLSGGNVHVFGLIESVHVPALFYVAEHLTHA